MTDEKRNSFVESLRALVRPSPPAHHTQWSYGGKPDWMICDANGARVAECVSDDMAEVICQAVNDWAIR
jgi:hypothetical protein